MSDTDLQFEAIILASLPPDRTVTEAELRERIETLGAALQIDTAIRQATLKSIEEKQAIRMDTGIQLVEDNHRPWVAGRKSSIDPFFWHRYRLFMERQKLPRLVLLGLDQTTDEILDLLGNPAEPASWRRRGLVMGDVQSGKTSNYTALTCKAADAGYRLIILLTGTLESLRRQTQERLDAGFVGFDSSGELRRNREGRTVGVGDIDRRRHATVFTSRLSDFRTATVQNLGLRLDALREPALVVVKKNARILRNLEDWLRQFNAHENGTIDLPMLLIDDEADNASINTGSEDTDPTAINACIRSILKLFTRNTYVGFTATPFANIFVDPDRDDEMLNDDLFPRDFIYLLSPPNNYFGPRPLFTSDEAEAAHLVDITDAQELMPLTHRSEFEVRELPASLCTAIDLFCVANAIRDIRGHVNTHRSMLINVSRFTRVQNQVELLVRDRLDHIQQACRNYSRLPFEQAMKDSMLSGLHDAWKEYYGSTEPGWDAIQKALIDAVIPIVSKAINQTTGAKSLDYASAAATGLRVIATGGNSLSRGLTLEGLCISYFYRNSRMYDTLLQMGRWFGYRDGYRDLTRIWLTDDARDWYGHITEATEELREEISRMRRLGLRPRDFGLQVRAHPDALLVTARNKMRASKEIERFVSVSARGFESVELAERLREDNWREAEAFISKLVKSGVPSGKSGLNNRIFREVRKVDVAAFLKNFRGAESDTRFQPQALADLVLDTSLPVLSEWDVVIPSGQANQTLKFAGEEIRPQRRRVEVDRGIYRVSGSKRRVGSRGIEREGLSDAQMAKAELAAKNDPEGSRTVSDRDYRAVRERPLLLIHVLDAFERVETGTGEGEGRDENRAPFRTGKPLLAVGLSFPRFEDSDNARRVKYRVNVVRLRELFESEVDDEEVDEQDLRV